ncbi:5'-nucleotidase C-terminal domain-containing protein [Sporosarcina sp. P17b]|uniref:5'-nucleotidase C-terminal domain-containing protein n=1 Tax=Sporosarcina sp. P17b TaxID=2048260 RepID=UPI000C16BCFE|nr:5'-nucleotidase C-terminal domain-containing protein [Sporosarcina sp. P17b]PIC75407.1 bifunctional metallophosphatase/5'-nucleotidase [Sporosarcina sp. P17b]
MKERTFRKFGATFVVASAVVVAGASVGAAEQWYSDVSKENTHYAAIKALTDQNIIQGYSENLFKPGNSIERRHAALILAKLGDFEEPTNVGEVLKKYKDVSGTSYYAKEMATLTNANVFNGDEKGNFNPTAALTRQQMANVLVKALNLEKYDTGEKVQINLSNVGESHKKGVQIMANLGLTDQLNNFRPNEPVTRGAFSSFIHRAQQLQPESGDFTLSLMHMNDTHARVAEMPKAITAIKEVRNEKPDALLLHGGDVFSGTLYFSEFEGQADLELMNLMGLDAMVFGNHEFDLGNSVNGHESLANFVKGANFPVISSNIDFSKDAHLKSLVSKTDFTSTPALGEIHKGLIKEVNGEKVGIFGLTTESTAFVASPGAVEFLDYKESAEKAVAYFESQGVNKIISVNHLGFDSDPSVGNDLLLAQAVEGIDIIVGGHSHTKLSEPVIVDKKANGDQKDPTVIVQADQYLTHLGTLDVEFDKNGVITGQAGKLISLKDKADDAEAAKALLKYSGKIDETFGKEIGATLEVDLPNPRSRGEEGPTDSVRANETALGNLVTDGMLEKAKEYDAKTVIALQNGGGIRNHLNKGPVTVGAVIEVLPFGNTLSLVTLTGAEIKNTLEHSVRNSPNEEGGFLHMSGMKMTFDSSKKPGERVQTMQVKMNGEYVNIEMDQEYVVSTNAFTARGGDGFELLGEAYEKGRVVDLGLDDWVNLRDHMVKLGTVKPEIEGRIIDLNK